MPQYQNNSFHYDVRRVDKIEIQHRKKQVGFPKKHFHGEAFL